MNEENNTNNNFTKFYIGCLILLVFIAILLFKHCGVPTIPSNSKPKFDSIYKSEKKQDSIINRATILENRLNLKDDSLLLLKKLLSKKPKHIYDSLRVADTSCQNSLIVLYNAFGELNRINDSIVSTKDLRLSEKDTIIKALNVKLVSKQNHIAIDSTYIKHLENDSIPKVKRKGFIKGFKVGFGSGVVVTESANVANKIKQ